MCRQLDWIWDREDEEVEEEDVDFSYPAGNVLRKASLELRWPREGGRDVNATKWPQGHLEGVAQSPQTDVEFRDTWDLVNKSQLIGSLRA